MRLKDLSLAGKMGVFIAAVTALNLLAGGWALYEGRQTLMEGKQREVTAIVEAAHSIVADFGARAAKGELSDGDARAGAITAIRGLRYQQDDYVWINDLDHIVVMHPIRPALEGQDVSGLKDPAGTRADSLAGHLEEVLP